MSRGAGEQISLREHVEDLLAAAQQAQQLQAVARYEAVVRALQAAERRVDSLDDLRGVIVPRSAFDEYVKASDARYHNATAGIHARIDDVRDRLAGLAATQAAGPPELRSLQDRVREEAGERITRNEYDAKHDALIRDIATVRSDIAALATKVAVGPPDLKDVQRLVAVSGGQQQGSLTMVRLAIAIGGLTLTTVGLLVTIIIFVATGGHKV